MMAVFHTGGRHRRPAEDGRRSSGWRRIGIVAIAGVLGIWATTALGFWQLRRAADKELLQQAVDAATRGAPIPLDATLLQEPTALVHRHVRLRGRWAPDRVVYLDNRPQAGRAGFFVLMPLDLEDPVAEVIVNRGWTPRNRDDRTRIGAYRTPDGTVDVTGVALAEEPRLLDLAPSVDRALNGIWQNFDRDAYARLSGRMPLLLVVRQDAGGPPTDDGLLRDWPDRGGALQGQIDRHHGYAFQWFALAATLGALLLVQVFRVISHGRRPFD